jgi:hypothetical protein
MRRKPLCIRQCMLGLGTGIGGFELQDVMRSGFRLQLELIICCELDARC